jgi:hypothetical protein
MSSKTSRGWNWPRPSKTSGPAVSLLDNRAAAALMAKLRGAAEHSDPLSGLSDQERVPCSIFLGEGPEPTSRSPRGMFLAEKTVKNYVFPTSWPKLGHGTPKPKRRFSGPKLAQSHRPRGMIQ